MCCTCISSDWCLNIWFLIRTWHIWKKTNTHALLQSNQSLQFSSCIFCVLWSVIVFLWMLANWARKNKNMQPIITKNRLIRWKCDQKYMEWRKKTVDFVLKKSLLILRAAKKIEHENWLFLRFDQTFSFFLDVVLFHRHCGINTWLELTK